MSLLTYVAPVSLNERLLPSSIYGDAPYRHVPLAVYVSRTMQEGITQLLRALLQKTGLSEEGTYFRVDAYLDADPSLQTLWVLEVTAQYVDGWGIALNLLRASSEPPPPSLDFPSTWVLDNPLYRPEVELDVREIAFATAGEVRPRVVTPEEMQEGDDPIYWYGWKAPSEPRIRPAHGYLLEDKIHLHRLSRGYVGEHQVSGTLPSMRSVRIPSMYTYEHCAWNDLPFPIVCKNRRKNVGVYGNVALCRTKTDTGKHARRAYERGEAVAQAYVEPYRHDTSRPTQLEILCIGTKPVTGYLLQGDPETFVLNDRVAHGPLFLL